MSPMTRLIDSLLLVLSLASPRLAAQTLTITNATVVDVSNGTLHRGMTSSSTAIGSRASARRRRRAARGDVVDAKGMFVIPGLWDMHTHAYFGWSRDFGDTYVLPLFIANGVTGIRDMGSDLDAVLRRATEVAAHRLVGPRMVVSGPMLDGPQVAFAASIAIKTPDDGRKAVDMLKSKGVDFIKVQSGVPRDAYFAIADEAKKLRHRLRGACARRDSRLRSRRRRPANVRASHRHLRGEHARRRRVSSSAATARGRIRPPTRASPRFSIATIPAREASIIHLLATNSVWQCPTLFWERGQWLVDVIDYTKDPDLAFTPRTWIEKKYPSMQKSIAASMDADPLAVRRRFVEHELDIVRKLHAAGVPFLAGTDTPAGVDVTPGISLHLELQRFVAAGFTPLEALQTATINPARFFGKLSDYGSVQADASRISSSFARIRSTTSRTRGRSRGVVADGRYWSPTEIERCGIA